MNGFTFSFDLHVLYYKEVAQESYRHRESEVVEASEGINKMDRNEASSHSNVIRNRCHNVTCDVVTQDKGMKDEADDVIGFQKFVHGSRFAAVGQDVADSEVDQQSDHHDDKTNGDQYDVFLSV
jgi:hypothetical protein